MASAAPGAARRRLRAPGESGQALLDPLPTLWSEIWKRNLTSEGRSIAGIPLANARRELLAAAREFTCHYRDVATPGGSDRIVMSGHQPEMFHPGVWFKNFVLANLGRRFSATSVQLLVDNDLYRTGSVRVPAGSLDKPRWESISFDRPTRALPYEVAGISDPESFESFARRASAAIEPFVADPLVDRFWPLAVSEYRRASNIGQALAAARHRLEADWGLASLEIPLSRVCGLSAFQRFAAHLLERIDILAPAYNRSVADFRRGHRLRSRNHPVPDLDIRPPEFEAPFWIWTRDEPARRRLYVHRESTGFRLHDRRGFERRVPRAGDLSEILSELAVSGVAIRPRALITTMFGRLVLSDLFLHGIGGAVYDQVADRLVREFFGIEPPGFLTLTATMRLPIDLPAVTPADLVGIDRHIRDLAFHPEKYLVPADAETETLVRAKGEWIARCAPGENLRERHLAIERINRGLAERLVDQAAGLREARARVASDLERARILAARDFAFTLFPHSLGDQLQRLAGEAIFDTEPAASAAAANRQVVDYPS